MGKFIDLTGKRFGRLLVIDRAPNKIKPSRQTKTTWLCRCGCGNETVVDSNNLIRGYTVSCGCYKNDIHSLSEGEAARNRAFSSYKRAAKRRNIDFFINIDDFSEITKQKCFYCGTEPSNLSKPSNSTRGYFSYNGIDRVDSSKGYMKDNIVPCCFTCNFAKRAMNINDFYGWSDRLYEYRHRKK